MSLVDKFVSGEVALNVLDSCLDDIHELSLVIDESYPDLCKRTSTVYYPTLNSFIDSEYTQCAMCFYNKNYTTWDGYRVLEKWMCDEYSVLTAEQILEKVKISIEEDEFMKVFV